MPPQRAPISSSSRSPVSFAQDCNARTPSGDRSCARRVPHTPTVPSVELKIPRAPPIPQSDRRAWALSSLHFSEQKSTALHPKHGTLRGGHQRLSCHCFSLEPLLPSAPLNSQLPARVSSSRALSFCLSTQPAGSISPNPLSSVNEEDPASAPLASGAEEAARPGERKDEGGENPPDSPPTGSRHPAQIEKSGPSSRSADPFFVSFFLFFSPASEERRETGDRERKTAAGLSRKTRCVPLCAVTFSDEVSIT
mmetsp:Transcript_11809/g.22655  ORF Transcript_11809/g.22655 Transcript_11809/m.22655 type:complete len:252 (-) Transcript_11809:344-1099(-)